MIHGLGNKELTQLPGIFGGKRVELQKLFLSFDDCNSLM